MLLRRPPALSHEEEVHNVQAVDEDERVWRGGTGRTVRLAGASVTVPARSSQTRTRRRLTAGDGAYRVDDLDELAFDAGVVGLGPAAWGRTGGLGVLAIRVAVRAHTRTGKMHAKGQQASKVSVHIHVCVCVCVCVHIEGKERQREKVKKARTS